LQDLGRRPPERVPRGDARDLLRRLVPEDHLALAVDGHDAVGDVREDREAAFLLESDALVELGVRQGGGGAGGQREHRVDLLVAPRAGIAAIDREDAERTAVRAAEWNAEVRRVACRQHRIDLAQARFCAGVLEHDRRA
jgi:hypothetical protein